MKYFDVDYLDFFEELSENNSKEWFDKNRKRYEKSVKTPFENFTVDMIAQLNLIDEKITMQAKDAMFRINRDIRFSNDKTPYKLHRACFISAGGKKDNAYPGYYIQLGKEGLILAGGIYEADKHIIQRFRTYIANNLDEFNSLINDKKFKDAFGELKGEKNKIIPKEFQQVFKKETYIANKQLYFWKEVDKKIIISENLVEFILENFKAAEKVKKFLTNAIL